MRSEYLENVESQPSVGGMLGTAAGGMYAFSTLDMLYEFANPSKGVSPGEFYVPWSKWGPGGKKSWSLLNKPGGIVERSTQRSLLGKLDIAFRGTKEEAFAMLAEKRESFASMLLGGSKYKSMGSKGLAGLALSRGAGFTLGWMSMTDPVWYTMNLLSTSPASWPFRAAYGVAWFGGWGYLKGAARALQEKRYIRMGQGFPETQGSFTSRQRTARAIAESHLQARSAIGGEAQLYHR
jgi:hypothetical protein